MTTLYIPQINTCGYFDCFHKFGSLKQSPKRIASSIEIELYLEDGYSTYINGNEFPNQVLKDIVYYLSKLSF